MENLAVGQKWLENDNNFPIVIEIMSIKDDIVTYRDFWYPNKDPETRKEGYKDLHKTLNKYYSLMITKTERFQHLYNKLNER